MTAAPRSVVFESFGVVLEVVADDDELFEAVPAALPPGWLPSESRPAARFRVSRSGKDSGRHLSPVALGSSVRRHVALHAPAHVFIHAGVVAVEGRAIVIPGRSGTGKTTLVAELLRLGADYLSDEYAAVGEDGMIHPFPKPLSIRPLDDSTAEGVPVPVPGDRIAHDPARAALIVVTGYEAGAEWRPEPLPRTEGVLALLDNTVAARSRPEAALAAATVLARDGVVMAGPRGEAAVAAIELLTSVRLTD